MCEPFETETAMLFARFYLMYSNCMSHSLSMADTHRLILLAESECNIRKSAELYQEISQRFNIMKNSMIHSSTKMSLSYLEKYTVSKYLTHLSQYT